VKKIAPSRKIDPNSKESMNRLLRLSAPAAVHLDYKKKNAPKIPHIRNYTSAGSRHKSVERSKSPAITQSLNV